MKRITILAGLILIMLGAQAQSAQDYSLSAGSNLTLPIGGSATLNILKFSAAGDPAPANDLGLGATNPVWMLNGQTGGTNSGEGELHTDLTFLKSTYTAPMQVPARNPVAVSVTFHPSDGSNSVVTLVCNITIVDAAYKVTLNGELTGPKGLHFLLSGVSYTNLKSFADGTASLMPVDGTKNMQIKVSFAGVPGKMVLVNPMQYDIPFVISVGNLKATGTAPAKISIEALSPVSGGVYQAEYYMTPGGIKPFPGYITHIFTSYFYKNTVSTDLDNADKASADRSFVERLKSHQNDPAYLHSAQGKADLQAMQKLMQQQGVGTMYASGGNRPANASDYSAAFVKGIQGTQQDPSAYATPPGMNTPSVMGGLLHFEGTFNQHSGSALSVSEETTPAAGLKGTIKITIEKTHP